MVLIGFSTPRSWNPLSALIRTLTRSTASHCWLLVEDPLFHLRLVLEAGSTGFRLVSFARFVRTNKVTALVMPAIPLEQGLPLAAAWLGEKFDVLGLFGMFVMFLKQWATNRLVRNPFYSTRALFCSEAVVRVLRAAKFPKIEQLGNKNTTPGQLLQWLNGNPANLVYQGESLRLWQHLKAGTKFDSRPPGLANLEQIPPVPELAA